MTQIYLCYDPFVACHIGRVTPSYWFTHADEAIRFTRKYNAAYPHMRCLCTETRHLDWGPIKPNPQQKILMAWYESRVSFFRAWNHSNLVGLTAQNLKWKILLPYPTNK